MSNTYELLPGEKRVEDYATSVKNKLTFSHFCFYLTIITLALNRV